MTMSINSWLLFILIACWLAISEEMSLKSILPSLEPNSSSIIFSTQVVKSSPKVHELEGHSNIKYSILKVI
jgi:ABC-type transport system involved in multi-copper enzyme maturation permease subunit